jgi:signal transduction histidine kinase/ActR/RegA family two-component response regulator
MHLAREAAPAAFRRWVRFGIALGLVGYALAIAVDLAAYGWRAPITGRLLVAEGVMLLGYAVARSGRTFAGATIANLGAWIEIHLGFITLVGPHPGPGLIALPALVLAFGLMFGLPAASGFAVLTAVTAWAAHRVSPAMRAEGFGPQDWYWYVLFCVSLFVTLGLLLMAVRAFRVVYDELQAEKQNLYEGMRAAPDGILVTDVAQRVVLANPAAQSLLGLPEDRIAGRALGDVLQEALGGAAPREAVLASGLEAPVALAWPGPPGSGEAAVRHVEVSTRAMALGRRFYQFRDVSARFREEAARAAVAAQSLERERAEAAGRLAGTLAHDFNNILTSVGGLADLLRDEPDAGMRRELAAELLATRDRGAALTRQLLAFAGRDVLEPVVHDLGPLLGQQRAALERLLRDGQRLDIQIEPGCWVRIDAPQFAQAMGNLVANAADAMAPAGRCTIVVQRASGERGVRQVLVRVQDDGMGMDAGTQAHAFEPLFSTKGRERGTGLGLAVVRAVAAQAAGFARLDSAPGRGTLVELGFPLADAPSAPRRATMEAGPVATRGRTVLLAEDDDGTRRTVARTLERHGYRVVVARDGADAIRVADRELDQVDVLVSDVMMPGLSGPALAERLRARRPDLPVLFITGFTEDAVRAHLAEVAGGWELLRKPFESAQLVARVERLAAGASSAVAPPA